jgi:hypothetical protein
MKMNSSQVICRYCDEGREKLIFIFKHLRDLRAYIATRSDDVPHKTIVSGQESRCMNSGMGSDFAW